MTYAAASPIIRSKHSAPYFPPQHHRTSRSLGMGKLPVPHSPVRDNQTERSALLPPSPHLSRLCSTIPSIVVPASPSSPVQRVADYATSLAASSVLTSPARAPTASLDSASTTRSAAPSHRADCRKVIIWRHLGCALLQRAFDFAVILLLTVIGPPDSFHLIATYGITVNLTVALLSPSAGAMIDRANRLRAVVFVTVAQNLCVVGCCACFVVLLWGHLPTNSPGWALCVALVHVGGASNVLFQGLSNVILERDWVVVLAAGDDAWLRTITANLKSIDLSCNLVAPFLVSLIQMAGGSGTIACTLSVGNLIMVSLQYTALHRIYHDVPALALKDEGGAGESAIGATLRVDRGTGMEGEDLSTCDREEERNSSDATSSSLSFGCMCRRVGRALHNFFSHAHTYAQQRAFLPGLALAMLYLTVLTFHSTMLAYLLTRGLHVTFIAIAQGGASGMGVLGTLCYQRAAARIGTVKVGVLAVWQQITCLTIAVGALYYPSWQGNHHSINEVSDDAQMAATALGIFMAGIGLSRLGLYAFDVAAAQLFQYLVEEKVRGVVGGFQRTLESMFQLLSYCLVLWRPHPEQFPSLAAISYFQVVAAGLVFTWFACRTPGRIVGLDPERGVRGRNGVNGEHNGSSSSSSGSGKVLDLGGSDALVDSPFAPSHHFEVPSPFPNGFHRLSSSSSSGQGGGGGEAVEGAEEARGRQER